MQYSFYRALRWFRRLVAIGFLVNMIFVIPALFNPRYLEALIDVGQTNTLHWLQDLALVLLVVTLTYIPVIRDPFRDIFITLLVVGGRFAAGMLFLIGVLYMNYPDGMWVLAGTDLILSTLQAILLYFTLRDGDPKSPFQHGRTRVV